MQYYFAFVHMKLFGGYFGVLGFHIFFSSVTNQIVSLTVSGFHLVFIYLHLTKLLLVSVAVSRETIRSNLFIFICSLK